MKLGVVVSLPATVAPKFPDLCARCGVKHPSATLSLRSVNVDVEASRSSRDRRSRRVEVPCCTRCATRVRTLRTSLRVLDVAVAFAAIFLAWLIVRDLEFRYRTRSRLGLLVALFASAPYFFLRTLTPSFGRITSRGDAIEYSFRNATYAAEFEKLNGDG